MMLALTDWSKWENTHCVPQPNAPRNCALWCGEEELALLEGRSRGWTWTTLAREHGRGKQAVEARARQLCTYAMRDKIQTYDYRGPTPEEARATLNRLSSGPESLREAYIARGERLFMPPEPPLFLLAGLC